MYLLTGDYQSVTICQLPLYHLFAMNVTMGPALFGGCKMVMLPKFEPKVFVSTLEKYKVIVDLWCFFLFSFSIYFFLPSQPTFLHLAPPLVSFLANNDSVTADHLSSLEHIVAAAAPSGPSLIAAFKAKAPKGVVYREGWGMTETSPLVMITPLDDELNGSCGVLAPNAEAKVIDLNTGESLGPNERGELCVKGVHVSMCTYVYSK